MHALVARDYQSSILPISPFCCSIRQRFDEFPKLTGMNVPCSRIHGRHGSGVVSCKPTRLMVSAPSANMGLETIAKENAKLQGGDSGPSGAEPVAAVEPQVRDDRGTDLPQALLLNITHLLVHGHTPSIAIFHQRLNTLVMFSRDIPLIPSYRAHQHGASAQGALEVASDERSNRAHHHGVRYQRNDSESMWLTALGEQEVQGW